MKNKFNFLNKVIFNQNFIYFFLLFLLFLIFYRSPHILTEGRFWGEEGSYFFSNSRNYGWFQGIFSFYPEGGYYNFFPRLASVLATFPDIEYAPLVTAYMSLTVYLTIITFIIFTESDLFHNKVQKFLASFLLIISPSFVPEVWLNTLNLQIYFGILTFIILFLKENQNNFFKNLT